MTVRNKVHSTIMALVSLYLGNWRLQQPEPRGSVVCGEAGVRLRRTPESVVGMDVAYLDAALTANQPEGTTLIDGPPVLAVEILSPSDVLEDVNEKTDEYLAAGVRLVWRIDPHDRTVTIYRSGRPAELVNETQELSGDPELPGFRVAVTHLFS